MNAILYSKKFNRYNIKKDSPRKKTLYKNRSIDRIFKDQINLNSTGYRTLLKKEKEKFRKLNSLLENKNPNLIQTQRNKVREQLIKPKLPLSHRMHIPKDIRLKKIESLRPSSLYFDNHVIKWMRSKYSQSTIEKSLYSIFPEKGKTERNKNETESEKRRREMIEFLEGSRELKGKEKYVKIHPKYFFDETTFEKIQKLKKIFLEFDTNGNNKMSLDEIVNMFNDNNIKAKEEDLIKLFFKNKKIKKKEYFKLYLTFYQFLNFALHNDQEFRHFMRKIKSKYKEEIKKNNNVEDENIYFPMNLNLLFDYFISKAKENSSFKKIKNAIDRINKVVTNSEKKQTDIKHFQNLNIENIENSKKPGKLNNEYSDLNMNDDIDLLENIDFEALFKEFSNLFSLKKLEDFQKAMSENKGKSLKNELKRVTKDINIDKNIKEFSSDLMKIKNNIILNKEIKKENIPVLYELSKNKDDEIANCIKRSLNRSTIIQLNMDNYKKYHNLKLALEATKENIKKMKKSGISSSNDNRKKKKINKSISMKSLSLFNKNYQMNLNDALKKCFLFKHKNLSKTNSTKLFSENELINFKKNSFLNKLNTNSIDEHLNRFSNKLARCNSSNFLGIDKTECCSSRKLDYVPMDLIKEK